MSPTPSAPSPAGVVVVGIGGTGMTAVNLLRERYPLPDAERLGLELIGVDSIRDDPRRLVGPRSVGIDTGPNASSFVLVPTDHRTVLTNTQASLTSCGFVTPKEAGARLATPQVEKGGFGTDPVCGALSYDAAPHEIVDRIARGVERVATSPGRPTQVVLVAGLGGGTGAGLIGRVARDLRARLRDNVTIWTIAILSGPYIPYVSGEDHAELRARTLATARELLVVDPVANGNFLLLADHVPAIGDRKAVDGTLAAVSTFVELMVLGAAQVHGRSMDWAHSDLQGAGLRERMGVIGGASLRGEPELWLDLVANDVAELVAQAASTPTTEIKDAARALTQTVLDTSSPLRRADEIRRSDPARTAAPIDPAVVRSSVIMTGLSSHDELPPLPGDMAAALGRGVVHRETVTTTVESMMQTDLDDLHAYGVAEGVRAAQELRRDLHRLLAEQLTGAAGDGVSLASDPAVLVRLELALSGVVDTLRKASERIASDVTGLTVVPERHPVRIAEEARDRAEERLPVRTRNRSRAEYLAASSDVREARAWEIAVGDARAGLDLLIDVADGVRSVVREAHRAFAFAAQVAGEARADARQMLVARHGRYGTEVVPHPDPQGIEAMQGLLLAQASPDRDMVESILGDLRLELQAAIESEPSEWRFRLVHPPVPGYDDTPGAVESKRRAEVLDVDTRLLPAMAVDRLRPTVDRLTLADHLAVDIERTGILGEGAAGQSDAAVADALRPYLDRLAAAAEPLAKTSDASQDARGGSDPVRRTLDFRPRENANPITVLGQTIKRVLEGSLGMDGATPVDASMLARMSLDLRVSDSRLVIWNDSLHDYWERADAMHISRATRRAYELEKKGLKLGKLRDRTLIPEVVHLLDDEDSLLAAASLMATDGFEQVVAGDEVEAPMCFAVTVSTFGDEVVDQLGPVTDPEEAIFALFEKRRAASRAAVQQRWRERWAAMVADLGQVEARARRRAAVRGLEAVLATPGSERGQDLYLASYFLVVERDAAAGYGVAAGRPVDLRVGEPGVAAPVNHG